MQQVASVRVNMPPFIVPSILRTFSALKYVEIQDIAGCGIPNVQDNIEQYATGTTISVCFFGSWMSFMSHMAESPSGAHTKSLAQGCHSPFRILLVHKLDKGHISFGITSGWSQMFPAGNQLQKSCETTVHYT